MKMIRASTVCVRLDFDSVLPDSRGKEETFLILKLYDKKEGNKAT